MLRIVCWKWKPIQGYRSHFKAEHVNTWGAMVRRFYKGPHELVCFTDEKEGIDPSIRVMDLPNEFANVPSPHGKSNPSCYRRLMMFSPKAKDLIGERFVSTDLDVVISGPLNPLWDRPEDFVMWGDTAKNTHYNGSMLLMTAGARPQVYDKFDPIESPRATIKQGMTGSDQAWISMCLGPREAKWTKDDGVYSFRNHLVPSPGRALPQGARIVFFHGSFDPWSPGIAEGYPWVKQYYRNGPNHTLVICPSPGVYQDLEVARAGFTYENYTVVNEVGAWWPYHVHNWVVTDPLAFPDWMKQRREAGLSKVKAVWTNKIENRRDLPAMRFVKFEGGTPELFAISIASNLCDRVVVVGADHDELLKHPIAQKPKVRVIQHGRVSNYLPPLKDWIREW